MPDERVECGFCPILSMSLEVRIASAQRLKDQGNELLNVGDFEEALQLYEQGLQLVSANDALVLPAREKVLSVRLPLLLNSVLCDLRMNPEEHTRRLTTSEARLAEVRQSFRIPIPFRPIFVESRPSRRMPPPQVLLEEPDNLKALFRKAQLHGRAGEYTEAKALLERLCRQQPSERAFRAELASLNTRTQAAEQETAAFWSAAVKKTLNVDKQDTVEIDQRDLGGHGAGMMLRAPTVFACLSLLFRWAQLLWDALHRRITTQHPRDEHELTHVL